MKKEKKKRDTLNEYRIWKLTLLELMAALSLLGLALFVVGRWLLGS